MRERARERGQEAAFTLAEVLITLGIIGIVAALTMPSLVANYKEKQTVVALKKAYSNIEQVVKLNLVENPEDYSVENIVKNFKTLKICQKGDKSCATSEYKYLSGDSCNIFGAKDMHNNYYAQLVDGTIIRYFTLKQCLVMGTTNALQNKCGEFTVDINGNKGPNTLGLDVFYFYVTPYGVVPSGTKDETMFTFEENCYSQGIACAAWVLQNENLDYAKCDGLGWDKVKSCKK